MSQRSIIAYTKRYNFIMRDEINLIFSFAMFTMYTIIFLLLISNVFKFNFIIKKSFLRILRKRQKSLDVLFFFDIYLSLNKVYQLKKITHKFSQSRYFLLAQIIFIKRLTYNTILIEYFLSVSQNLI